MDENVKEKVAPNENATPNTENELDQDQEAQVDLESEKVLDEVETMEAKLAEMESKQQETFDRLLRLQAEYDNFKKRTQKERIAERKYKSQDLANELLPILDNFERALQVEVTEENKGMVDGISMIYNQLAEALKNQGVNQIEATGQSFDPNLHHAIMQVEEEGIDSNIVVEELQKGYLIHDRVIRPAMVKVNK